ncbi:MAG: hypothetical protein WC256_02545 [Desulfurivibrionaceae bacterium]|jgi:hypothetical protein
MKNIGDILSSSVKIATDILFVNNPVGTSMGVLFGVLLHGSSCIFSPLFETIKAINFAAINIFHYIAFGIFSFNIRNFYKKHKVAPEVIEAINFIEKQVVEGRITKTEAKLQYREIISKVVSNVQFDISTESKIQNLATINQRFK